MKLSDEIKHRVDWLDVIAEKENDGRVDPDWLAFDESHYLRRLARKIDAEECKARCAKKWVDKLIAKIEDMKCDCDGEVYEALLKIAEILKA